MKDKDLEVKNRLVGLARKKAERQGTTLESQVETWLVRYINEPDEAANQPIKNGNPSRKPAMRTTIPRSIDSSSKTSIPGRSKSDTRSEAYRRLLGVMSDSSKRTS